MKKIIFSVSLMLANVSFAANPVFLITPLVLPPAQLYHGEQGTAIYQVFNNSPYALNDIALMPLPAGITQAFEPHATYCNQPLNLASNESCLLKLNIDGNFAVNIQQAAPLLCYSAAYPIYCSQPFSTEQLHTTVLAANAPATCNANIANFAAELAQNYGSAVSPDPNWGPYPNTLSLSSANPDLSNCPISAGINWQQGRILAAADLWIRQKLNYCHHHVPDWPTPVIKRGATTAQGGYCSPAVDAMPGSIYYQQQARWNYSGSNSETADNWLNKERMWYGMDCSNYTAFLYNFAFGIRFESETGWQAGQRGDNSQTTLSPNEQTPGNELDNPDAAGSLVCADNTLEVAHSCAGHGGYISVIQSDGTRHPEDISDNILNNLHPGDLLYIAANHFNGVPTALVTHVIMWTGKKVGTSGNDIPANRIAPDTLCPMSSWQPQTGAWVITDSHYQGPDYRVLSACFYRNNIWGVRRVIA